MGGPASLACRLPSQPPGKHVLAVLDSLGTLEAPEKVGIAAALAVCLPADVTAMGCIPAPAAWASIPLTVSLATAALPQWRPAVEARLDQLLSDSSQRHAGETVAAAPPNKQAAVALKFV